MQLEQFQWKVGDSKTVSRWHDYSCLTRPTWLEKLWLFSFPVILSWCWWFVQLLGTFPRHFPQTFMVPVGWIVEIMSVRSGAALKSNVCFFYEQIFPKFIAFPSMWLCCLETYGPFMAACLWPFVNLQVKMDGWSVSCFLPFCKLILAMPEPFKMVNWQTQ